MSVLTLTRQQVRRVDRLAIEKYGMSGLVLMENAGRGCVDTLMKLGTGGPVVICCGKGNNAGDGFVMARHLDLRGVPVRVAAWGNPDKLTGDAAINWQILLKTGVRIVQMPAEYNASVLATELHQAQWIVDALLGTGAKGVPRPPLDQVIGQLNAAPALRMAVDLPSGLDCDTGATPGAVFRAHHTCTFVAAKPGFFVSGADQFTGKLHVLDIGAPRKLIEEVTSQGAR